MTRTIYYIRYAQIIFYHLYITDAGRNATLSATHPSSIRNLETMTSDYMRTLWRILGIRLQTLRTRRVT